MPPHSLTHTTFFFFNLSPTLCGICALVARPCMWQQGGPACEDGRHVDVGVLSSFLFSSALKSTLHTVSPTRP